MNKIGVYAAGIAMAALLSGCTTAPCCIAPSIASAPGAPATFQGHKFLAVGYGAIGGNSSQYTVGQQKLMAMRAARVDAYRTLAEQVYGFRISGSTSVSVFSTQNDNIRIYVDSYIRGARLVNMTPVADGNFEATVELDLTHAFFSCLSNTSTCNTPVTTQRENLCAVSGCVQPSAFYYSN